MSAGLPLNASGVSISFGGNHALDGVSVEVRPDRWLGLIGPNGSGKTTLLNILTGIYRADAGLVSLGERDITRAGPTMRGRLGVVRTFQHPQLAGSLTILQNIMLGASLAERRDGGQIRRRSAASRERAELVAKEFGCLDYGDSVPDEVPYGIRKVAEVARAAAAEPVVLLLDEPAAGLSREERAELIVALEGFSTTMPTTSVCLIEHDVPLVAALCPEIVVLDAGKVLASGQTSKVLSDSSVREAYLGDEVGAEMDGGGDAGDA